MERKIKRRTYMRNIMRQYKKDRKMEVVYLRSLQEMLEAELQYLAARHSTSTSSTLELSWKEVARAFKDERHQAVVEQAEVKAVVLEYQSLARDMQHWVTVQMSVPDALNVRIPAWRLVHLPSNPRSRALGKEWITQRMYHNLEQVFKDHHMPPAHASNPESFEFAMSSDNTTLDFLHRLQFVSYYPPSIIVSTFRHMLCSMLLVDRHDPALHVSRHEVDNSTSMHTVTTSQGERINLLTREFHDHDRVVLVAQQIQDDENHPTTCPQRHRSLWVEMTSMQPSGVCVVRVMYMYSQLYRGDVPCTLGEESSYWDFDAQSTPPHLFPNHARRTAMLFLPSARQRVREFVQQTVLDMRANNDRPS
ncbi:hypothetical protein AaE_013366 [Aphanomyces astaci]|uniref:Uncharacterized protein n=1 Tax=Aphanomyces astaci TaxID=112090 RepID=A0A6A4Z7H8_APHAT|nr:hypothetical protein AaE_013366 [Aphanomyces astaci]